MIKILSFAGSARKHSYNKYLANAAADHAEASGALVTRIDLADYPMPIFCQDLEAEQGMPEAAQAFKQLLIEHDGFLIASPEYNSAYSPLLKNAIDWATRRQGDEPPLLAFRGKVAALMSTSPGALGGLRGLVSLRMLLGNIGVLVLPDQLAVGQAEQAFDAEGLLTNEANNKALKDIVSSLITTLERLQ
ncbi:NAD(P)H-dependent oxidoreductase [Aestuariirhabdus sp. Z084]|uniref:NADPH-dependent FMN reductase n=1 Tax=Aestuariirhabdus haliotis TaxID=2918751 RepID=UPI0020BE2FE8|nr:NAD(P)H-dependent oxidoreductase [Aestuariirhabdus haliotis]MCL6416671.1 NAD(P)H-dependent oxidoreductase [Aestuariirhabdus haliotis]